MDIFLAIVPALITGTLTLLGVLVANNKNQAVIKVQVEELTREVRAHNGFAERIPALEEKCESLEKMMKVYHRGDD